MEDRTQMAESQVVADIVRDHFRPELMTVTGQDGQTDTQVLVLPDGQGGLKAQSVKTFVDEYRQNPERRKGSASLLTLDSLIDHINRFQDADSAVFADNSREAPSMTAIFDYHRRVNTTDGNGEIHFDPAARPRFGDHRGTYRFPLSHEWKEWANFDGETLSQGEFAEFLEDRIGDVEVPPEFSDAPDDEDEPTQRLLQLLVTLGGTLASPGRLMELSRGLKVTAEEQVHQATNLSNGEAQIQYTHEHLDEQGQPLKVPNLFLINIPVFNSGDLFRIPVRLRYRVRGGQISWSYLLYRTDKVFDAAFDDAVDRVRDKTGLPVFVGHPEK